MLLLAITWVVLLRNVAGEVEEDGYWMDINREHDVHLVYFNNYTTVLHIKKKLSYAEDSEFSNYSKVAKTLRGKNFFTKLDGKVVSYVVEDFLESVPGIIFYYKKAAYVYNGSFAYEACEKFSDPEWAPEPEEYIHLNSTNYDEIFPHIEFGIILACGQEEEKHDWTNLGRLKTVAEKLKPHGIGVYVLNNKTDPELVAKLKLTHLGTLKFIRMAKLYVFKQDKQDHVMGRKFPSHLVTSYKLGLYMLKSFPTEDIGMFLGVFEKENNSWFKIYKEIVYSYSDDFQFFHTFDKETGEKFGCKQKDCLITLFPERVKSPYEEEHQATMALSPEKLLDFDIVSQHLFKAARPFVGHMSNYMKVSNVFRGSFPRAVLYMDIEFEGFAFKENQYRIKPLWQLAREFRQLTFAFANRNDHESTLKGRKLDDTGNEADLVIEHSDKYYYVMEDEFNLNDARAFIKSYIAGTIKPILRSGPVPKEPYTSDGIRVLVGKNFYNIVYKEPKHFIILINTNYGDEPKKFDKLFIDTKQKYKEMTELEFATLNIDENVPPPEFDTPEQTVIFFVPKDDKKKIVKFEKQNETTIDHLTAFIEDNFLSKIKKTDGKSEL